jgi:hypothetical protein
MLYVSDRFLRWLMFLGKFLMILSANVAISIHDSAICYPFLAGFQIMNHI